LAAVIRIAASRKLVFAEHYCGQWLDIGTPQRLAEAEALFNQRP
jgi:NDP-sugar pyrophosphorylase family protein